MSSANLSNSSQFEFASSATAAKARSRYYAKPVKGRFDVSVAVKIAMFAMAITGLALSSYLGWASFTSSKIAGCGSGEIFDCGHVMQTKWSSVFGVPVGFPAAGLYLTLLSSLVVLSTAKTNQVRQVAKTVVATCAFMAGVAAIWFISLQVFVVEHLCQYCLAAHACGLVLVILSVWNFSMNKMKMVKLSVLSLIAVGILATSQVMAEAPQTFQIEEHTPTATQLNASQSLEEAPSEVFAAPGFAAPASSSDKSEKPDSNSGTNPKTSAAPNQSSAVAPGMLRNRIRMGIAGLLSPSASFVTYSPQDDSEQSGQGQADTQEQEEERLVPINGGSTKLNAAHWPLVGDANAEIIFIELFDYTCPHCRENFKTVQAAKEQMGEDKLATLALCVPMNTNCNKTVRVNHAKHAEACELAKLATAVWRIDPEQYQEYHKWLLTGEQAPTAAAALAKAKEMVDQEKLAAELEGDVVQQYIAKQVQLYQSVGAGTVPKMLFSGTTVSGKIGSADTLIQIIKQQQ